MGTQRPSLEVLRRRAARQRGLPSALCEWLRGQTLEELNADAGLLLEALTVSRAELLRLGPRREPVPDWWHTPIGGQRPRGT